MYESMSTVNLGGLAGASLNTDDDKQDTLVAREIEYTIMLISQRQITSGDLPISVEGALGKAATEGVSLDSATGHDVVFSADLMSARSALRTASPDAVDRYKGVLRSNPSALVGWQELAQCYGLSGQTNASIVALAGGALICSPRIQAGGGSSSATVAPLKLRMAATHMVMGRAEGGLSYISDAFRSGKGGAAGHVLRGVISLRLGRNNLATQAFEKAKDVDPAVATLVEGLITSPTPGGLESL